MSCTKHFLGFTWERHQWQRHVSACEIVTGQETNMWAQVVEREYMRCDKQDVCAECGKVRRQVSCICDLRRGETCAFRQQSGIEPASRIPLHL